MREQASTQSTTQQKTAQPMIRRLPRHPGSKSRLRSKRQALHRSGPQTREADRRSETSGRACPCRDESEPSPPLARRSRSVPRTRDLGHETSDLEVRCDIRQARCSGHSHHRLPPRRQRPWRLPGAPREQRYPWPGLYYFRRCSIPSPSSFNAAAGTSPSNVRTKSPWMRLYTLKGPEMNIPTRSG